MEGLGRWRSLGDGEIIILLLRYPITPLLHYSVTPLLRYPVTPHTSSYLLIPPHTSSYLLIPPHTSSTSPTFSNPLDRQS
jgi:hypothetical protein